MTDKQLFFAVLGIICAALLCVGLIGGDCVADCEAAGNSPARCHNICRP